VSQRTLGSSSLGAWGVLMQQWGGLPSSTQQRVVIAAPIPCFSLTGRHWAAPGRAYVPGTQATASVALVAPTLLVAEPAAMVSQPVLMVLVAPLREL
jgi:hypothetical protein